MGARLGGQTESIPVASVARIKVVSVDYRLAPEHKFPAASEDVAAVYRELLKSYKPENIGIFGSSAGGLLAAQSVAWFQKEKLPRPGAIGILCASAAGRWEGDSEHLWIPGGVDHVGPYLKDAELSDPLVAPFWSTQVLAEFPATLIMTSTRAFDLSAAVETDLRLTKVGVQSELHVWDGLGHCMFGNAGTPEAADATAIMAKFFDRHLGRE
jgi:acetyl esterase/lipase